MGEMKAIIQRRYGGPEKLKIETAQIPDISDSQLLIEIHAADVSSGDWRQNTLSIPAPFKPIARLVFGITGPRNKIRGTSAAGVVISKGSKVENYNIGDKVYFISSKKNGCWAEFIAIDESGPIALVPENMTLAEAAPLAFGALTAFQFVNISTIQDGTKALIYGASGSVGSYALQLAKYYGADVTAVASSKHHSSLLALGADSLIDYTKQDFRLESTKYDFIFDAVGKISKKSCKPVLTDGGKYCSTWSPTKEDPNLMTSINTIIEEGKLESLIAGVYPFDAFKEALIHTYEGHKSGNVIIEILNQK